MRNAVRPSTRQRAASMRVSIPRRLSGSVAVPTAAEVAQQVGGTVGLCSGPQKLGTNSSVVTKTPQLPP